MSANKPSEDQKGRKNLIFATIISIPGPLLLAISMADGTSATQTADFIRRSCEFLTIFLAWMVYEVTVRRPSGSGTRKERLEVLIQYFTGFSMCLSGGIMIYVAVANFSGEKGSVTTSFIFAVIGAIINVKLYRDYKTMRNAVLSVQAKLHRVKILLDCALVLILLVCMLSPNDMVKRYADVIDSCSISLYLIWSGIRKHGEWIHRGCCG